MSDNETDNPKESTFSSCHIFLFAAVIFAILLLYYGAVCHYFATSDLRGQFGDTFGAVSCFFTALGFGGVLLTLWQQNKESVKRDAESSKQLRLLNDNSAAMTRSSEALTKQLGVMTASAKLSVLPDLIEATLRHLEVHHGSQLSTIGANNVTIRTYEIDELKERIARAERFLEVSKKKNILRKQLTADELPYLVNIGNIESFEAFIPNLKHLLKFREDLIALYDQLS